VTQPSLGNVALLGDSLHQSPRGYRRRGRSTAPAAGGSLAQSIVLFRHHYKPRSHQLDYECDRERPKNNVQADCGSDGNVAASDCYELVSHARVRTHRTRLHLRFGASCWCCCFPQLQVYCALCIVCCGLYGVLCIVYCVLCIVCCVLCMVCGAWCVVRGVWCVVFWVFCSVVCCVVLCCLCCVVLCCVVLCCAGLLILVQAQ
jgi:hypothetical protein